MHRDSDGDSVDGEGIFITQGDRDLIEPDQLVSGHIEAEIHAAPSAPQIRFDY